MSLITDDLERPINVVSKVPESLVNIVPSFSGFPDQFQSTSLVISSDLEVFDFENLKWKKATILSVGNAYRSSLYGRKYYYLSDLSDNGAVICTYFMAKILSARFKNIRVHGYDPKRKIFISRKGFGLPDIYERILVSSSGFLPGLNNKNCFEYHGVNKNVAKVLLEKIYKK